MKLYSVSKSLTHLKRSPLSIATQFPSLSRINLYPQIFSVLGQRGDIQATRFASNLAPSRVLFHSRVRKTTKSEPSSISSTTEVNGDSSPPQLQSGDETEGTGRGEAKVVDRPQEEKLIGKEIGRREEVVNETVEQQKGTIDDQKKVDGIPVVIFNELLDKKKENVPIEIRQQKFNVQLSMMKIEAVAEKTTEHICPKPYSHEGDKNEFDIDKELGPTVDDWEVAPFHRVNREMPGQVLYKAEKEDIDILSKSKWKYFGPNDSPDAMVYRLVRMSDAVTTPVGRMQHNSRVGIREDDRWRVVFAGYTIAFVCTLLGLWQMRRIKWKRDLLEFRRNRMTAPITVIDSGPLPWVENLEEWKFRIVQLRGVLDPSKPLCVGPREHSNNSSTPYFSIFNILRMEDGTTVLVNRGNVDLEKWWKIEPSLELPQWVTVRGVVHPGEEPGFARWLTQNYMGNVVRGALAKESYFSFIEPAVLAQKAGVVDVDGTGKAVVEALDILYDEDIGKLPGERIRAPSMYHLTKKGRFFEFWCSEHTHFNYAMQWVCSTDEKGFNRFLTHFDHEKKTSPFLINGSIQALRFLDVRK